MKWLHFILSHSIFIAFCAAGLCYQTYHLLHLQPDVYIFAFIFCATLSSYNFYWLISKYSFAKKARGLAFLGANKTYISLFLIAGLGMFVCLIFLRQYYSFVAISIALTLLYSLPLWPFRFVTFTRKAGFLKTIILSATWAFVTVLIPAKPVIHTQLETVAVLFFARFCFMLMLCILFDMRDMKMDKLRSLHSLATDVSKRAMQIIMYVVFIIYILAGFFVRNYFHDDKQMIAFALMGVLVWVVYRLSLSKERGYFFYYFLVDGLMLISAASTYIAAI